MRSTHGAGVTPMWLVRWDLQELYPAFLCAEAHCKRRLAGGVASSVVWPRHRRPDVPPELSNSLPQTFPGRGDAKPSPTPKLWRPVAACPTTQLRSPPPGSIPTI